VVLDRGVEVGPQLWGNHMQFRAAVLHRINEPLRIERVSVADPGPHEVLVRMAASGLCHTDLEVATGALAQPLPAVLGHEGAGIVEAVGSLVRSVQIGDRVVCSWTPYCGSCFYCRQQQTILCESVGKAVRGGTLLNEHPSLRLEGQPLFHFSVVSSHAEYCVVPEAGAIPIQQDMPLDRACLLGCAVMTGVAAAVRIAEIAAGSHVVVIGCGAVGLNAIQGAVLRTADRIVAVDTSRERAEKALSFGATEICVLQGGDAADDLRARCNAGRGADYVIECAGNSAGFRLAVEVARPGGMVVWLGKVPVSEEVSFRWGSLMGEKRIIRSSYGGARPAVDFPWLSRLYLQGRLKLDELISNRIALDRINDGFTALRDRSAIRTVVVF
jgi:S-(hydroxymethyl)glutathione dehydrogenase / alcohol dehydrogenase